MAYVGRQPLGGEVIVLDDIQSQFNGVLTSFTLQRSIGGTATSFYPVTTAQLLVSLGGTIQEPDRGGSRGFKIDGNQIVFATPPPANTDCFIVSYGNVTDLVDYSELTGFKSTVENDNIYYVEDLSIIQTQTVGNQQSNTFFTLAPTVTVNNSVDFTVGDGESLSIEALAGGGGGGGSPYVLPTATTTTLGGVRIDGTTISISGGIISATQNTDYNNLINTPDLSLLSRINDANRTTNDILAWDGTNWVDTNTLTGLTLTNCAGTISGTSGTFSHYSHSYVNGTTTGLKIYGTEAVLDIVGQNAGDHAAGIVIRGENNGFGINFDPTQDSLCINTFVAVADGFIIHGQGSGGNVSNFGQRLKIGRTTGHILPGADATQDLGSSTARWANIYSADLQLSNEGSANDVDGTWGQYTIQEGENDLFLLNRRNGKTYKFVLQEVN